MERHDPRRPSGTPPSRRPTGPTRAELTDGIANELKQCGLESPRLEAERLVCTVLGLTRGELVAEGAVRVSPEDAVAIARAVSRRIERVPLQHIEGSVDFRRIVLVSDGRALVPRPETEQLVDVVARTLGRDAPAGRVLEVGAGSGAIALSLVHEGLARHVVALDVSAEALEQAAENTDRLQMADAVDLRLCRSDIWTAVATDPPFDLIVSNPPYIATAEIERLDPEVRDHDPRPALDGGEDGLSIIRTIIAGAGDAVVDGGAIVLEIGAGQAEAVRALFAEDGRWEDVRIEPDLAGRDRFATACAAAAKGPPD